MLLKQYKTQFVAALKNLYDEKEIESFFYIILEDFHNMKRIDLALNPNIQLKEEQLQKWEIVLEQLKLSKPIQYIIGQTVFFGLPFCVNEHTLIPRPETEELVEWIINQNLNTQNTLKILDIGTGSGCIAITLVKNIINAKVYAIDVCKNALDMAQKNAILNNVSVTFLNQDILKTESLVEKFDIIVSNPPYVRALEKNEMHQNVLHYEPHLALFVKDNDPLIFYKQIAQLAAKSLANNGKLYFEINQYLGNEMVAMLEDYNFKNIVLKKDIYGNDRMIECQKQQVS